MSKSSGYMNDYSASFENSKVDFNHFYHQQDHGTFDYIPTSHQHIQDLDSLMYSQQHEAKENTMTGMVTATPGIAYLAEKEHRVYTTTNSDTVGSCTTSGRNTLPMMTGSSSSSSNNSSGSMETDPITMNMTLTASNSATTSSISSPPPSLWTPTASPSSTASTSLTCMNAHLVLPVSSSTSPSFLSSLSPSISMGTEIDTINYVSNSNIFQQQQPPLQFHHSQSLDYPSPMPILYQQQQTCSASITTPSPTFMPSSHRSSLTSSTSPQTTDLPIMTTSASAPTTMISNNDNQTPTSELQHLMDLSSQPIHANENDQAVLPMDHSQTQPNTSTTANTELRRQIHIQSEQKRRAQIKDGFEDLRNELPSSLNKKMSKVALLQRTIQHIQHLKSTQISILGELERLMNENEHLKKFQENVIQLPESVTPYHDPNSM